MNELKEIPPEVAALIPKVQLKMTRNNLPEFSDAILKLKTLLEKCPKIRETDGMKEHPAIFHYFYGSTDIYICEYDRKDYMFGYAILGGDLRFSEWGYFDLNDLTRIQQYNIDYHFAEQSIEAALYEQYPHHFKKPLSLEEKEPEKNDPLPDNYRNFPYDYLKGSLGTRLRKNLDEVYLYGDDETKFFQDCNRAKQHSRSISEVIEEYFIN